MSEKILFTQEDIEQGYYPLRPFQKWLIDRHFNKVKTTMMNIGFLLKLNPQIDVDKLAESVNTMLKRHDVFRTRLVFHPQKNELCQRFDGEIFPVVVENWSDEEFESFKKFLAEPFLIIDKPLYRFYIFKTPSANYFFIDIYHAILDGTATAILIGHELSMIYKGKIFKSDPVNYADYIAAEMSLAPEIFESAKNYWKNLLKNFGDEKHLPPPDISEKPTWKKNKFEYDFKNITKKFFHDSGLKETNFFMAVSMIAISKLAKSKKMLMTWVHNGRINPKESRLIGLMIEQLPIAWDFSQDITVEKFLQGVDTELVEGLKNIKGLDFVYDGYYEDGCATFIFQKKNYLVPDKPMICGVPSEVLELKSNFWSAAQNTLDIEIVLLDDGNYFLELSYDSGNYSEDAMKNFAEVIDKIILKMQDKNILVSEVLGED